MTRITLPYVHRFRDRHGKLRHYFRRPGHKQAALPGLPGSAEFMTAYQAALEGRPSPIAADRTDPHSISALVASWYGSAGFKQLAPSSQATYRRIMERFRAEHGGKPFKLLEARHVREMISEKAETPAAANRLLSLLRLLMRHAVECGKRDDDPTVHVRRVRYRKAGFATWSEADIAAFEARWPIGTRARLAFTLMLYTGQRRSDVIRMGRQHIRAGRIEVRQQKGGERLTIPVHPALREVIAACPSEHLTFLMTEAGRPFASGNAFYNWFKTCIAVAGLAGDLSPHGLRKATARRLAQAKCTPHEIMAVTGHRTLAEVMRYTREVDQQDMADTAIARIGRKQPSEA
jgi:integrase